MRVGETFDGEFYVHDWHFQRITETVTKVRDWAHDLEYHVFDVVDTASPFIVRRERFTEPKTIGCPLKFVTSYLITHESEVENWHDKFVAEGYEGVIVRNTDGLYKLDHRSKDLQKYKTFQDNEYEIVGGVAEVIIDPVTHKEIKAIVFTCKLPNGSTFNVRPKGTVDYRAELYRKLHKLINLPLTVRFQEFSRDGVPIFPVGICIRNYE
jgi:DNA ligase-1